MRGSWQFISTVLGIIFRHPVTGTTIIPILPDGRIVLIRRSDSGKWGLPGGMIDWGEDIPHAASRELKEETGLALNKIKRLRGVYSDPKRDPRIHSISILLEVEAEGELDPIDTHEVLEIEAFSPDKLPLGDLSHDHDRQLKDYLEDLITVA